MLREGEENAKSIDALRAVAQAVTGSVERQIAALQELSATTKARAAEQIQQYESQIPGLLLGDMDPFRLGWNPFRLLNVADDEPRWTQWLNGIGTASTKASSQLIWRALCAAVAESAHRRPPMAQNRVRIANAASWRAAASEADVAWRAEVASEGLGTIDLVAHAGSVLNAGIEVKLREDWHDSKRPQSDRYRDLVARIQEYTPRDVVGLVLLTCREDVDVPSDYVHLTWRQFARSIRRLLTTELAGASATSIRELLPALLTAASIEMEILDFHFLDHHRAPLPHLTQWSALVAYLEESRA